MFRINQKLLPYFKGFSFSEDVICIHEISILFELSRFGRNDEYKGSKMLRYKGGLSPLIDEAVRKRKKQVGSSWRDLH